MIYNLINIFRFLCFFILYICACMTNNNACDFVSSSVHIILQNEGNWRIKVRGRERKKKSRGFQSEIYTST